MELAAGMQRSDANLTTTPVSGQFVVSLVEGAANSVDKLLVGITIFLANLSQGYTRGSGLVDQLAQTIL